MNTQSHPSFLQEMGITEWVSRDAQSPVMNEAQTISKSAEVTSNQSVPAASALRGNWWFFGKKPEGNVELLFANMVRALGLSDAEWSWKSPMENLNALELPQNGLPTVAVAFGTGAAQRLTGEGDPIEALRETVLALNGDMVEEVPVVASFELERFISKPKDKVLLWQDLLLARSVLQSL